MSILTAEEGPPTISSFQLQLQPRPVGCTGWTGCCRQPSAYLADLGYCSCGEAPYTEHAGEPDHELDLEADLPLCVDCAARVREYPVLLSIRTWRCAG